MSTTKRKNISGEDLIVMPLGGRLVAAGQVIDADDEYDWPTDQWAPVSKSKKAEES